MSGKEASVKKSAGKAVGDINAVLADGKPLLIGNEAAALAAARSVLVSLMRRL